MSPFFRYSLVGAGATLLHYLVLTLLVEWRHWPAGWAAVCGAACGAVFAYLGNRRHTFSSGATHAQALPRFLAVAVMTAALSGALVGLGAQLGVHYLIAQAIASGTALLLGYRLNKRWSFA
ncbi:MAG: GtrA family protein [Paucibacter sp.]|nr:GtrA family protein [Roseateles sp.]